MKKRKLKRGDLVQSVNGSNYGIVVAVLHHQRSKDGSLEKEGYVKVWLENQTNFGCDNCEYFVESNWEQDLRLLSEKDYKRLRNQEKVKFYETPHH